MLTTHTKNGLAAPLDYFKTSTHKNRHLSSRGSRFSSGRYAFALAEMESRAKEIGEEAIEDATEIATVAARTALATEFTWASIRSAKSTARGNALQLTDHGFFDGAMVVPIRQKDPRI